MGRWRTWAVWLALLPVVPASAQNLPNFPPAGEARGLLPGYTGYISLETLSGGDSRFEWDFDLGADVDLLRAGPARVNLLVNYESVLGKQLQRFDPIFNNYTIDVTGGAEAGAFELAVRFHHLSRHLGDRQKRFGIAWNAVGPQVAWRFDGGAVDAQVRGWVLAVYNRYYVDYTTEAGADAIVEHVLSPRWAVVGRGSAIVMAVEGSARRDTQSGGRLEGALRFNGGRALLELYLAADRRIDADPIDARPVTWAVAGLRLMTR
jgi:hypothetical protein